MALGKSPIQIVDSGDYPLLTTASHWERIPMSDIATVQNGCAFSSKYFNHDKGMPLIRIRDVLRDHTENLYSGEFEEAYVVRKGDLLIGMDGDFSAAIWKGADGLLNQRVCRLIQHSKLYFPRFLFVVLQPYLNAIHAETSSVTVKHLSSRTISEIPLPLPPLNEQKRIVEKIEALFSEIDAGVASLQQAREQLGVYRQALLKKAFTGTLTAQWRAENPGQIEPAEELLERIRQEREARYQQQVDDWKAAVQAWEAEGKEGKKPAKPREPKDIEPLTEEEVSELPELPEGISWVKIGQISDAIGGYAFPSGDFRESGTHQVIKIANVRMGYLRLDERPSFVNQPDATVVQKYGLMHGDCIVSLTGTRKKRDYGFIAMVTGNKDLLLNQRLGCIRLLGGLEPRFYELALRSEQFQNYFFSQETGNVGQGNVSMKAITSGPIMLPSLPEQKEIVRLLEAQFEAIEQNEREIDAALARAEALCQSILKKAFSGQLVEQDPEDEPASFLLDRIRAEREAVAAKKPKRM